MAIKIQSPKSISTLIHCTYDANVRSKLKLRLKSKWYRLKYGFYFHRSKIRWEDLIESWFVVTMVLMAVAFNLLFIATWIRKQAAPERTNPLLSHFPNPSRLEIVNPAFPSTLDLCNGGRNFDFCKCSQSQTYFDYKMEYDLGLQCTWIDSPLTDKSTITMDIPQRPFAKYIESKLSSQRIISSLHFQTPTETKSITTAVSKDADQSLKYVDKHNQIKKSYARLNARTSMGDEKRILMDCAYLSLVCALFQFCLGMCRTTVIDWIVQLRAKDSETVSHIMMQWTQCTLMMHKQRVQQCVDTVEQISKVLSGPNSPNLQQPMDEDCNDSDGGDQSDDGSSNRKFRRRSSLTPSAVIAALKCALQANSHSATNKEFDFEELKISNHTMMLPRDIEQLIVDFTWKRTFDAKNYVQTIDKTQKGTFFKYLCQSLIYSQLGLLTAIILAIFVGFQWVLRMYADDAFVFVVACQVPVIWCFITTFLLPELVSR